LRPATQNYRLAAVLATTAAATASITATASAAAITTTATAAAATRAGTIFAGTRFVYGQRATVNIFAVQGLDRCIGTFFGVHGDEREAPGASAEFVHDHIDFGHGTVSGEEILELVFGCVEGKISDKQFCTHDDSTFD
jgi:hypothetical protein